jgi:hypothetical protein
VPGEEEEEEAVQQAGRKEASFRVNDRVVQVTDQILSEILWSLHLWSSCLEQDGHAAASYSATTVLLT